MSLASRAVAIRSTEVKYDYRLTPDGEWITIQSLDDLPEPELCGFFIEVCLAAKDDCDVTDKCKSSFTIGGGQSLSIHCPKNEDLSACDENSLNVYQAWLDAFGVQGGCNTEVKYDYRLTPDGEWITIQSINDLPEPELCGFFIEVCLAAKDDCDVADKCKSSFTIGGGQSLSIHCPKNEDLSACDENSLDVYQAWLDEFGVQGGCNTEVKYDYRLTPDGEWITIQSLDDLPEPELCGFFIEVCLAAKDDCDMADKCKSSFTINPVDPLELKCPGDEMVGPCLSEDEIKMAFDKWLLKFGVTGGCDPEYYFEEKPIAPDPCGGEVIVKLIALDQCGGPISCQASFGIDQAESLTISCPNDLTITDCHTQEEVDNALENWLSTFSYSGGCQVVEKRPQAEAPMVCLGGIVKVSYEVADQCTTLVCERSFTVEIASTSELSVNCPKDQIEDPDQTQEDIDLAFAAWKSQFGANGGCNTSYVIKVEDQIVDIDEIQAPNACGGDITVEIVATSLCAKESCQSTFTVVASGEALILALPQRSSVCKNTPGAPSAADVPPARSDEEIVNVFLQISACVPKIEIGVSHQLAGPVLNGSDYIFTRSYLVVAPGVGSVEASEEFVFTHDPNPPTLVGVPPHVSLPCGSALPAWPTVTADDLEDGDVEVSQSQIKETGVCGQDVYIRSWTAKDDCGNSVTKKQTIIIGGGEDPGIEVPADTTIYCPNSIPDPYYLIEEGQCVKIEVEFSEHRSYINECEFDIVRTWIAKDRCGNSTTVGQTIQVRDTSAPVITVVNPMIAGMEQGGEMIVYGCDNPQVQMGDIEVSGECCGAATIETEDRLIGANLCNLYGYYRRWRCSFTVTDYAGNISEFYFYVLQYDTTAPEIINIPADIELPCGSDFPPIDRNITAVDDCSIGVTSTVDEQLFIDPEDNNKIAKVRTWTFKDACGNKSQASQIITICRFDTTLLSASLGNTVWLDGNGNGLQDEGEEGINDVQVYLYQVSSDEDAELRLMDSTRTKKIGGKNGQFRFKRLTADAYRLRFVAPERMRHTPYNQGYDDAKDSDVDPSNGMTSIIYLSDGETLDDVDAGFTLSSGAYANIASFEAASQGCENELKWMTEGEYLISRYIIERSVGGAYEPIGELRAIGDEERVIEYRFEDPAPKLYNQYRLKIIEEDGGVQYSDLKSVTTICRQIGEQVNVFPNPTRGRSRLTFTTHKPGTVQISIFDKLGKELQTISKVYEKGPQSDILDLSQFPEGVYYIRLNQDGLLGNFTVVKS